MPTSPRHAVMLAALLVASAATARAHMLMIVPDTDAPPSQAGVYVTESLNREEEIPADIVKGAKLLARTADGKDAALELHPDAQRGMVVDVPTGATTLHGSHDMGVNARGGTAHRLIYHPKAILGEAGAPLNAPVELTPRQNANGGVSILMTVDGNPVGNAEVTTILPGGGQTRVKTDAAGLTPPLEAAGRWGAWAKRVVAEAGEVDGKAFKETRHYATVVFEVAAKDVVAAKVPTTAPVAATSRPAVDRSVSQQGQSAARNPHAFDDAVEMRPIETLDWKLPEATSSFGAVAADGWLYVYGGHVAPVHSYSTTAVSGGFWRRDLSSNDSAWQTLPSGPAMQGMNLAAAGGKVYRIGGMQPVNEPGSEADVRSLTDASVFDPATKAWSALPKLPEPRSSHDVVVIGRTLYVVGGWNVQGSTSDPAGWPEAMLTLNLDDAKATWQSVPQPFLRRALIAANHGGKLFVIGGFDAEDKPSRRVDLYDPATNTWSRGPGLPGGAINGFSAAAAVQDNRLYVSVFDGNVYVLNDDEFRWEPIAKGTPRIVHRMVPSGERLLILGGATRRDNLDLVESLRPNVAPTNDQAASN